MISDPSCASRLDNLNPIIERVAKTDPAMAAEMRADLATGSARRWPTCVRSTVRQQAESSSDNEVGLKYIQEQFASASRQGPMDLKRLVAEGEWLKPPSIGEVRPFHLDALATELGYKDEAALRRALGPAVYGPDGVLISGGKDAAWLKEVLSEHLSANPEQAKRVVAAVQFQWKPFWSDLQETMGLSGRLTRQLQDVVAKSARLRKMDPGEYLSQVMSTNLKSADLKTGMGQLVQFLKAGGGRDPMASLAKIYRGHLDLSAQETLVNTFKADLPRMIQEAYDLKNPTLGAELNKIATALEGGTAESGGATTAEVLPMGHSHRIP